MLTCCLCLFVCQMWYALSKTMAEDAAWKFVSKNSIDMVSINPVMVAGPLLQPEVNASVEPILNLVNGNIYLLMNLCFLKIKIKKVSALPAS